MSSYEETHVVLPCHLRLLLAIAGVLWLGILLLFGAPFWLYILLFSLWGTSDVCAAWCARQ